MGNPFFLRRTTDTDLVNLVVRLTEAVGRLEEKVDMLIVRMADESPDTGWGVDLIDTHGRAPLPDEKARA